MSTGCKQRIDCVIHANPTAHHLCYLLVHLRLNPHIRTVICSHITLVNRYWSSRLNTIIVQESAGMIVHFPAGPLNIKYVFFTQLCVLVENR